jgi:transaldolase
VEGRKPRKRHDQSAGYSEGIPAFRQLISEGINVNVTLLFAQPVYEQVAAASSTAWNASLAAAAM